MNRTTIGAVIVAVIAGAALLGRSLSEGNADEAAAVVQPVPVQVARVTKGDVPVHLTGIGTVQAFNTVTVRTQVSGQLQTVYFTEGQQVKKGDILAEIDPRSFEAAVEQASGKLQQDRANLANAEVTLTRFQNLAPKGFATEQGLDNQNSTVEQLKAQIVQDKAALDAAAVQLAYTRLVAPIDGRTGIRLVDAGNIVHPSDTTGLVVITQTRPISVVSTLPENALSPVRAAMKAGVVPVAAFTKDGTSKLGDGTLSLINNEIDQASGTLQLKSTFPNADDALWPGQFVELRLRQQLLHDAITIPAAAVQRGQQGFFVYAVGSGNLVEAKPVTLRQIADGRAIVESGLSVGDQVVTSGAYALESGVKVSFDTTAVPAPDTTASR